MEGMIGQGNTWITKLLRDKWWVLHVASIFVFISSFFSSLAMIGNTIGFSLNIIFLLYAFSLTRPIAEETHTHAEDGSCCNHQAANTGLGLGAKKPKAN